jgi:hypothetical protein
MSKAIKIELPAGPNKLKRKPTPRHEVYDLYWKFAAKRQEIFERRIRGLPAPWSDDPILQSFKFCNVYRAADRVSQFLIREVVCNITKNSNADRLFQIAAFRTFSKPQTWIDLSSELGHPPTLSDLESGGFEDILSGIKNRGNGLYTGAFILCANKAFGFDEKHRNHTALFKQMFLECDVARKIETAPSLKAIVELLESFPLIGPFMSYQIAIDLNYSSIVNFDEDDFTQAGPGAIRGIKKAFVDMGEYNASEIIKWMVDNQEKEFARLKLRFGGLWGRRLHAIDCQGLFCELDKYCREAVPALTSIRSRIKTRFNPSKEPLKLFFPPKWRLNEQIEHSITASQKGSEFHLISESEGSRRRH